jgi:plasmid stabilization system protein ParE
MSNYELAAAAEADLEGVALYSLARWGVKQAIRYGTVLDAHFEAIGKGHAKARIFCNADQSCVSTG